MYCYSCGEGMAKSDSFCASCGAPAKETESTSATEPETTTAETTTEPLTTETTASTTKAPTTKKQTTKPAATKPATTKPTTTKVPTVSDPVIPDPGLYFGLARYEDELFRYGTEYDYHHDITYKTDLSYPQALQEYISLISDDKYQFELITKYEFASSTDHYLFRYTGEKDIPHVSHYNYKHWTCDSSCDLVVSISYFAKDNTAYLALLYSPDAPFKLVDPGKRTSFTLRDLSYLS
ncbi:MAG: hypothetical protein IIW48_04580 [Clostridia bacterium]|nr:hypothetical protein [Clostridia bacterium]